MSTINSTSANETLTGTTGADTYVFSNGFGQDNISDGGGTDTVDLSAVTAGLTINLTAGAGDEVTDGINTVNWTGDIVENAKGGSGNDSMTGNSGANTLDGGSGSDTLSALSGNDSLIGGAGSDNMDGGDGNDYYIFANGWGNDSITADSSGSDTLDFTAVTTALTINATTGVGTEVTDGTNTVDIAGDFIEFVKGGTGNDNITGNSLDNVLLGNTGDDTLSGGLGNDTLRGDAGNDSIDGGSGNDEYDYFNSWGNDTISDSAGGADQLYLYNVSSALTINLTTGAGVEITDGTNTVELGSSVIERVESGSAADTITGNSADNWLYGHGGNDTISGVDGNDNIIGGGGNDSLAGDNGNDIFYFGSNFANDTNTWGNDVITDSAGSDQVWLGNIVNNLTINLTSGAGDEVTDGTNTVNWSSDIIEKAYSGSGNDSITGSSVANTLEGNGGNDTLNGQAGNDNLDGGAGNDTYQFSGTWGADTITADTSGSDTVDLSGASAALTINLATGAGNEISDGTNTVNWSSDFIENATGGSGNDTITGNALANVLRGGGGINTITGGAGNDSLYGSIGDTDYFIEGDNSGSDYYSSAGTARLNYSAMTSPITFDVAAGTVTVGSDVDTLIGIYEVLGSNGAGDTIDGSNNSQGIWVTPVYGTVSHVDSADAGHSYQYHVDNFENAIGSAYDDIIYGTSVNNLFYGNAGDDQLYAGDGQNTLYGGVGNDYLHSTGTGSYLDAGDGDDSLYGSGTLIGGTGNDTLNSQTTNASLDGGSGNDLYYMSDNNTSGTNTIADASGNDTVSFWYSSPSSATFVINLDTTGTEVTSGSYSIDWAQGIIENIIAGSGNDSIAGSSADNMLNGGYGNDTIDGGSGNDTLLGYVGYDSILGGVGDDWIDGGGYTDSLYGGSGNDTYNFATDYGVGDIINDSGGTADKVTFDSTIGQSKVAMFIDGSGNLQIGYTDSASTITVQSQTTSSNTIERFELSNGYYLTDADVTQVISDMASYASAHSISFTSLDDVKNDTNLMAIMNAAWHT
jgi:Ca2+-binding RTX toxin-like protein